MFEINDTPPENVRTKGSRSGMILAFALVILLLMSLMGLIILSNTQTELKISGNSRLGREAFSSADSCARIATFLTLVLVKPKEETIADVLTSPTGTPPRFPLEIETQPKFTYSSLLTEATNFDYTKRYDETGIGSASSDPHIIFSMNGRVVATAVVNIETHNIIDAGASLGTVEPHESGDGPSIQLGIIVLVTGRTNSGAALGSDEPASVVTIMYRNFMD